MVMLGGKGRRLKIGEAVRVLSEIIRFYTHKFASIRLKNGL